MKQSQPILVAIDIYSEYERVLRKALYFMPKRETIHLIFVVLPPTFFQAHSASIDTKFVEDNIKQGIMRLKTIAAKFKIPATNIHVETGEIAEQICSTANKVKAKLIVLGLHGRDGVRPIIGTVTKQVLQEAEQDALVVHLNGSGHEIKKSN